MSEIVVHTFQPSGYHTYNGGKPICTCGSIKDARVHDVPETPDEAREIDSRVLGESE